MSTMSLRTTDFSGRKKADFANVYFTTQNQLIVHLWRGSSCQRPCSLRFSLQCV